MEAIEKAKEIIIKMQFSKPPIMFDKAKQCALICIDEKQKTLKPWATSYMGRAQMEELIKVKQAIKKL